MIILLLTLAFARTFHPVVLVKVATTAHTHVSTCGTVVYVKHEADGDWHLTLSDGRVQLVAEIIPELPLPVPQKGQRIRVTGISREDRQHRWFELHPVLSWQAVASCR